MRHLYVAEKLHKEGRLAGLIIEERENFLPVPDEHLSIRDRNNFIKHFADRDKAEKKYFGNVDKKEMLTSIPTMQVTSETLNSTESVMFIKNVNASMLLSYGVHKLRDEIINCYENKSFNIHGGLSPWYKGSITLFWPFYFLKPNYAGMTIHKLSQKLDGGEILHHSVPKLEYGDKIHDVASKAVVKVAEDLCKILEYHDTGAELICERQKVNGKLFLNKDWTPQTLRVIYDLFDNKIVDMYLNGELGNKDTPTLVNFFDQN